MEGTPQQQDTREAPGVVLSIARYWRPSLVLVVTCAALAYAGSLLLPERYVAVAELGLTDTRGSNVFTQVGGALPEDLERHTARQAELVESSANFTRTQEYIDGYSVRELFRRVEADWEIPGLVNITASAGSAKEAQELANAVADAYSAESRERTNGVATQAINAVNTARLPIVAQIDSLQQDLDDTPGDTSIREQLRLAQTSLSELNTRANEIRANAAALNDGLDYVERARLPRSPKDPQPARNAAVAGLLGFLVAGAAAWIRADRHRAADESAVPEQVLGSPMLGTVPALEPDADLAALSDPTSPAAEAYQFVTASLQYLFKWGVVLVTSSGRRDGKTVSAASMAAAAARDGTRVILVDADGRSRGLTRRLMGTAGERAPGLTDLAAGRAERHEVIQLLGLSEDVAMPFVPAGSDTMNLASLFRAQGTAVAVTTLRNEYDLVVVDCPAVLAVADVASFATHADGIVLVVARGTPVKSLEAVRQRLDLVAAPLIGYIFARADAEPDGPADSSYLPFGLSGRRRRNGQRSAAGVNGRQHGDADGPRSTEGNGSPARRSRRASRFRPSS